VPDSRRLAERAWFGRSTADGVLRAAVLPAETLYRVGVAARAALYDHGLLATREPAVPALSVGNLSVGGTGKTPIAAWLARRLREAGASPAIVMRGYGDDEPLVHRTLNPDVPVITSPDRLAGAQRAAENGADCIVLDDAFQHRRIARRADIVLVSADRWDGRTRLLPAGPWREPLSGLRRSSLVLVTRKSVGPSVAQSVAQELVRHTAAPAAIVALGLGPLHMHSGAESPLGALEGRRVLAVAALGDPSAFGRQLEDAGAIVRTAFYPDHHRCSLEDARALSAGLEQDEWAVCTLKDHVKLAPLWPRATSSLWYVSQRVVPEFGESAIDEALDSVLRARKF
jgi:tetraacyldisaccharide 4'-kinase